MIQGLKSRIGKNGQITIPVIFRLFYGLRPGDEFEVTAGKLGHLDLRIFKKGSPYDQQPKRVYKKKRRCALCGSLPA